MNPTSKRARDGAGWHCLGLQRLPTHTMAVRWIKGPLSVLSAVELAEREEVGSDLVPHFHVSVCGLAPGGMSTRQATDEEVERVRADFGMGGAEEDNHGPGNARHLWLRCDVDRQAECPCKQDEDRIVEGDRVRYEAAP